MSAVSKKLASFLSSPSSSPRIKPSTPVTELPPIAPLSSDDPAANVTRSGMPCSSQLFDVFKAMAGRNTDAGLGGGEPDSDEDDISDLSGPSTAVSSESEDTTPRTPALVLGEEAQNRKWVEQVAKQTEKERNTLSARFTALSLSNLVCPKARHSAKKKRVAGTSRLSEEPEEMSEEEHVEEEEVAGVPISGAVGVSDITNAEKIKAIVEEFGEIANLIEGDEPERMLADTKGSLFKGVMMIGNLHLTTHRLLFHAIIPPDSETHNDSSAAQQSGAPESPHPAQPDIIYAGPVTIHRPGPLKKTKRVWMELTSEMVTTYPSAEDKDLVRPIRCVLLSSVHENQPLDPLHPCDFSVTYETPVGLRKTHFTVDTEQSAIQWRRAFEGALFRNAKTKWRTAAGLSAGDEWSTLRCCIPLDRVRIKGISDYHSFATLIGLDVGFIEEEEAKPPVAHGDLAGDDEPSQPGTPTRSMSSSSKRPAATPKSPHEIGRQSSMHWLDTSLPPFLAAARREAGGLKTHPTRVCRWHNEVGFNIGVFKEQVWFTKIFQSAVAKASTYSYKPDVVIPKMIFQVAGHDCLATDEAIEMASSQRSSESEEMDDESGLDRLVQDTRKAEKAALAAKVFGLREDEPVWIKRCYVAAGFVPARGHIILTSKFLCFWRRNTVGPDIKYRFHMDDIKGAVTAPAIRVGFHGMALQIHGHRDLRFEFWKAEFRDEVVDRINASLRGHDRAPSLLSEQKPPAPLFESPPLFRTDSPALLQPPVDNHPADILAPKKADMYQSTALSAEAVTYMPFVANRPNGKMISITPRTFVCLTIGSRGDVQPYIALGLRLKRDGHKVIIVTHPEFKTWVEGYGIQHRQAGGDPTMLMKLSQEHKMFSPGFFKESLGGFRTWLDDLLYDSWSACQDADVLIESPSTMSGIHIAEALKIPYFRAFTMPWTRTSAYPHAFMVPAFEMGPSFNYSTYVLFDNIMWKATAGQINRWRKKHLGLPPTDMTSLSVTKVPFLYNFSSAVVPKPLDWHDDISITGYWTLEDSDTDWSPSPELDDFMQRAKADGKPLVYIGFGSIVVPRPNEMTKSVIQAVEKAGVRAIIAKGWSSRGGDPATEGEDIEFPASCFGVEKIPHGWLFPKVQAALHHGGAGTVGASLRAGIPTLIKPWFGDQFFWSVRVTKLGVGLKVPSLRADDIAAALIKATTDTTMIEKASRIGERIRSENGVDNAIQAIQYNLSRAASDRRNLKWAS
ncbi:hypothetical protein I316_00215 [Kwoniella heveanensis BCC8398]|uniref:sterol 3beta-glucosyltransferase n=1 Tax=Kwoniella heveanensis BCC8398 TaxID=1296120 RepID=A0A1B9H3Z3_9TREE|nr:hypothetical protein I316_00215 [Kwoniella heveanensis BCC8398]